MNKKTFLMWVVIYYLALWLTGFIISQFVYWYNQPFFLDIFFYGSMTFGAVFSLVGLPVYILYRVFKS